jgi:hypothetical protein
MGPRCEIQKTTVDCRSGHERPRFPTPPIYMPFSW